MYHDFFTASEFYLSYFTQLFAQLLIHQIHGFDWTRKKAIENFKRILLFLKKIFNDTQKIYQSLYLQMFMFKYYFVID